MGHCALHQFYQGALTAGDAAGAGTQLSTERQVGLEFREYKAWERARLSQGLAGGSPPALSPRGTQAGPGRAAANRSALKTGSRAASPGQAGARRFAGSGIGTTVLSMLTFTSPRGSSKASAGCAKSCLGKGRETSAPVSWVFIPASQCHHHRHHLQKGVLGAGGPSCSDKTGKSSQSSLVPAPDGLPAGAR